MGTKKKSVREEIEYRLGLYFSLKSGAMYVRDEKFGDQEEILRRLQADIITDIKFLTKKEGHGKLDPDMSFKDVVLHYKNKLMK